MPPRFTYWTIILDGGPTAFRAADREELLPTLKQLQSRHPDAVLRWFARGKLWNSPEEMREHARLKRSGSLYRERGPDWRPGSGKGDASFPVRPKKLPSPSRPREERRQGRPERPPREEPERPEKGGPRGPASGGWKSRPPRFDSRQRRPYRPTGGSRRGGGGRGRP